MSGPSQISTSATQSRFFYGWIIVAVSVITIAVTYGIMYSYSVFFKPLVDYFHWDRATVSSVYSMALVLRGFAGIAMGWLADRYGPVKISLFCGVVAGLGLVLTSRVTELWQLYVTFGLIEAIGLSGSYGIGTAITARWFTKKRGMALGITASGAGLGTFFMLPTAERLISNYGWSTAFFIFGILAFLIITSTAFLFKSPPQETPGQSITTEKQPAHDGTKTPPRARELDVTMGAAIRSQKMIITTIVFFLFIFCLQVIMAHLVNYATDVGISPFQAATFVSLIGIVSIAGRLVMGSASDKIGINNSLLLCCAMLSVSLVMLLFTKSIWAFYLFAVVFGFAYGGEMPQIPMFVGHFFGTKSMAALVGFILSITGIGGALGPWVGGKLYDITLNYQLAFIVTIAASLVALGLSFVLKVFILKEYTRKDDKSLLTAGKKI